MYADGANLDEIKKLRTNPLVKGFTTNPTLMRAAGISNYMDFAIAVSQIANPLPISLEVFADDFEEMEEQARKLSSIASNVFVKIPITNTRGEPSTQTIRRLSEQGINLNVTAIFTSKQIEQVVACASENSSLILSIFAGRIADAGVDPIPIFGFARQQIADLKNLKILWASPREIFNLIQAEESGCDIITMTPDLWRKLPGIGKDLDTFSLETVQMFFDDASKSNFKL